MSARGFGGAAPGLKRSSTPRATVASRSVASIMAKPVPMHTRGPAPKGTYAPFGPMPFRGYSESASLRHRSGSNSSGFDQ